MNVIVSNKQKNIIDSANIDAIKDLNGLFNIDDLISKFRNYFFSKMILDATSVIDFTKDEVLSKLVNEIGSEKLFILLPATPDPPKEFVDKLIGYGIYNFSNKIEEIVSYIDNPRTYDDLYNEVDDSNNDYQIDQRSDNNNTFDNYNNNTSFSDALNTLDISAVDDGNVNNEMTNTFDANQDALESDFDQQSNIENNSIQGYPNEIENDNDLESVNRSDYEFYINKDEQNENSDEETDNNVILNNRKYIIGFKNVTSHAGSTTFAYLLLKALSDKQVCAIEVNRDDFKYYQDSRMISINERDIDKFLNDSTYNIILVDLNNCQNTSFCDEVLYLVEPSVIKLNKLMMENRLTFRELQYKKIILNKSLLSSDDVEVLSKEAGVKMFYNMPPVNDRKESKEINELIKKIGI